MAASRACTPPSWIMSSPSLNKLAQLRFPMEPTCINPILLWNNVHSRLPQTHSQPCQVGLRCLVPCPPHGKSASQGACDEWGRGQARSVALISASTPWQAGPLPLHREWACLEKGSQGQGGGQPVGLVREALCLCAGQYAVPQS